MGGVAKRSAAGPWRRYPRLRSAAMSVNAHDAPMAFDS
jgi:hypothetical protein